MPSVKISWLRNGLIRGISIILLIAGLLIFLNGCSASNPSSYEEAQGEEITQAAGEVQTENGGLGDEAGARETEADAQSERGGLESGASGQAGGVPPYDPKAAAVIKTGNPNRKMVTLTIDDGWNKDDRILGLLESHGIRCTVFPIGGRGVAEANPEWIRRMDRGGFEVCTHTYSHYKLTDHPEQWISDDIRKGREVIASVTGKRYPYMRPPGGFLNDAIISAAAANGCYVVMWSNSLGDTNPNITVDAEVSAVLSNLRNGDIILCHFGGYHTYEALSRLIPEIENRGYSFGTLTELLIP